jgi:uncharacterized protein DUF4340
MKNKTLINLSLISIIILISILAKNYWPKFQALKANEYVQTVSTFDQDEVSTISLKQGVDEIVLTKQFNDWLINNKKVELSKINKLLNPLFTDTSPTLSAQSEKQLNNLGIANEQTIHLTLKTSDKELNFFIGNRLSTNNTIVAITDQSKAYSLPNLPTILLDPNTWYDLTMVDLTSETLSQVVTTNFTLTKNEEGTWQLDNFESADPNKINQYIMNFNPLTSTKIADEETKLAYNLLFSSFKLELHTTNDEIHTLDFYQGEEEYLVKRTVSDSQEYFILSSYLAEDLIQVSSDFIAEAE